MSTTEDELASINRVDVSLRRSSTIATDDQSLWSAIRNRTDAIGFNQYSAFIARLLEDADDTNSKRKTSKQLIEYGEPVLGDQLRTYARRLSLYGTDGYQFLKLATQAFLLLESGVAVRPGDSVDPTSLVPGEEQRSGEALTYDELQGKLETYLNAEIGDIKGQGLPYLKRIVNALIGPGTESRTRHYQHILSYRLTHPSLIELIHSYWLEQGALMQGINAIALRFQNRRLNGHDPLAPLEIDPLRPLNNLMWGFIQDEMNRLSVPRRAYEYDHQYGLHLYGKAVANLNSADSRTKFLEGFHTLLNRAAQFFGEDADTTVIADGFALLSALKDVHLLLAEGAHNQFRDLPTQARVESLITQWLLARPEMREFLRGRAMVPYREPWMGQLDTMKRLYGWPDVSTNHFRDLAAYGEQLLLSIRYGDWIDVNDQEQARNWARYFKPELQSYMHSYLAVTGVDLAAPTTDSRHVSDRFLQPSVHLRNRLALQKSRSVRALSSRTQDGGFTETLTRTRLLSRSREE
jgi:hypothetical protein